MKRPGKTSVRKAIAACGGEVAAIAASYGVARATVYAWLDYYQLRSELEGARAGMLMIAEDVAYERLLSDDADTRWDAARFVLERLGRGRWSKRSEVTGADGSELFDAETLRIMRQYGLDESEVVKEFTALLQSSVLAGGDDNGGD